MTSEVPAASQERSADRLWTVPNALSILRLPLAAAFMLFDSVTVRVGVLAVATLTDALDGFIARSHRQTSPTGALLDALFDKFFVFVVLATILFEGRIGIVGFCVVISRDLYTGLGYLASRWLRGNVPVVARFGGKVVTVLQLATLFVLVLAPAWALTFVVAVGLASAYAIVDYTVAGLRAVRQAS